MNNMVTKLCTEPNVSAVRLAACEQSIENPTMRDPIAEFKEYNRALCAPQPGTVAAQGGPHGGRAVSLFPGYVSPRRARHDRQILRLVRPRVGGRRAREMDLVGDIHTENYGTYQADDGIHYDINDFDETTHGRFDFDARRMTTSVILAAQDRQDTLEDATLAALAFLNAYVEMVRRMLKKGIEYDVNEKKLSNCVPVDHLVRDMAATKRQTFIGKTTELKNGKRNLLRSLRYFNLPDQEREQAVRLLADYRKRAPAPASADFYEVQDVCGRVSGIGSMGESTGVRYVVLVNGKRE